MNSMTALVLAHFDSPTPYQSISRRSRLTGRGWVIADSGIRRLSLYLNDVFLCDAEWGLPRPDIAERFPLWPESAYAGFEFSANLTGDAAAGSDNRIGLRVETSTWISIVKEVPVTSYGGGAEADGGAGQGGQALASQGIAHLPSNGPVERRVASEISFAIDAPMLDGDRARDVVSGFLIVSGWAVADSGISRIEVHVDAQRSIPARYGLRRPDIAQTLLDKPGALLCGFVATVPDRLQGDHRISVVFHSRAGDIAEKTFQITAESIETAAGCLRPCATLSDGAAELAVRAVDRMACPPFFTIVIREDAAQTNRPDRRALTEASLRLQAYPHWRVAVGDSDLTYFGPGGSQRDALDFVMVLNAGDQLGADALLMFAREVALQPQADFLYGDEVRWDPALRAHHPWYKPDWAPDLLFSTNYIGRAWCVSSRVLENAGLGARLGIVGDYEIVLRLTEAATAILHIPGLLLEQVADATEPVIAERRALQHAVWRQAVDGQVVAGAAPGTYRLKRRVAPFAMVSIIIPTCGADGRIETAITSLRRQTDYRHYEIICVENIPETQSARRAWVRAHADQVVQAPPEFNWSEYNNLGARHAKGDYLLFLNDDVEIFEPVWLHALLEHAARPEVGAVGALLLYPDGTIQHAGMFLDGAVGRHAFRGAPATDPGPFGLALTQRNVLAVTGACMLIRRAVFDQMSGFNSAHSVVNNDLDFCLRLHQTDLRVIYTPFARLIHHELASRAALPDIFDETRFAADWRMLFLKGDPFFNPLLSIGQDNYADETEPLEGLAGSRPLLAADRVAEILVVQVDDAEDSLLTFPALRRLKQHFSTAKLRVLGSAKVGSMAALEPAVDTFIIFDACILADAPYPPEDMAREAAALRTYQFNIAIDFRQSPNRRDMLKLSGARLLAGFDPDERFSWLDISVDSGGHRVGHETPPTITDQVLHLTDVVVTACRPSPALPKTVPVPSDLRQLCGRSAPIGFFERPIVCLDVTARSGVWQWPVASFVALVDLLCDDPGVSVVLVGDDRDAPIAQDILQDVAMPERVVSLLGQIVAETLPEVLRGVALYIGNDSGWQHVAAALPIPTVSIHAYHIDPRERATPGAHVVTIWRRVTCGPCHLPHPSVCPRGLYCLHSIRPGDVYRVCLRLLRLVYGLPANTVPVNTCFRTLTKLPLTTKA